MENDKRAACIGLLKAAYDKEPGRYPKRSDFSEDEVQLIKAVLGPWPRALEAAGIKPAANEEKLKKREEKRIRAKIKIRNYKKEGKTK